MATDPTYLDFVLEQLRSVLPAVTAKSMFGGTGIYHHDLFFALIAGDTLYFRTDESSRAAYEALDMPTFHRGYYEVPIGVLEDSDELRAWAEKAVSAAQKAKRKRLKPTQSV